MTTQQPDTMVAALQADALVASAVGRAGRRLVPFLVLLYALAVLDRINVGFAAVSMNQTIGLTASMFGFGASLFLVGYLILEVPSNVMLVRVGARRWLARIAVSWGLVTCTMALVRGPSSFYAVRFVVGAAEAGCLPGVLFFLTQWFPAAYRARFNGLFLVSIPLTNALSGPVSAALLALDGAAGLAGWQWLFLIEGVASMAAGVAALVVLVDTPLQAAWLSAPERRALQERLAAERAAVGDGGHGGMAWRALAAPTVILLCVAYIGINLQLNTAAFWFPQIFARLLHAHAAIAAASSIPFLAGAATMVVWGRQSDRTGHRIAHVVAAVVLSSAGWLAAGLAGSAVPMVIALSVAMSGGFAAMTIFWTLPPRLLTGANAAAGIAMISAVGTLGSAGASSAIGLLREGSADFSSGLYLVAATVLICPALLLVIRGRLGAKAVPAATV